MIDHEYFEWHLGMKLLANCNEMFRSYFIPDAFMTQPGLKPAGLQN